MQLHLKMDCYISDEVAAVLCRFTQLRVLVFGCRIVRGNGFGQVYEGVKSTLVKLDLSGSMGRTADVRDALHHVSTLTCLKLLYLDYTNASHLPALPVSLTHLTAANINSSQGLDLRYLTRLRSLGLDAVCVQGLRCPQSLHVLDVSASEIWYDPLDAIRDAAQLTALYAYGCGWGTSELIAILPTTLVAMEIGKFEKDTRDLARICSHLPKLNFLGFALWGDQNEEIGLGLTVLTALSGLTYLDVSDPESSMCESVFKYVGTLTSLEHLRIEGDSERDALPNSCLRHLSNLTRLTCLDAKYNGFTDAGKTLLSHLPRLKLLKC